MLVLTRKAQEKIQIGENITITVLRTKGKAVRLGIEAPDSVAVLRGELAARQAETDAQTAPAPTTAVQTDAPAERNPNWQPAPSRSDNMVSMQRVSRSRVATVLPQMLGAPMIGQSRPLRAMLERRAATPQA